MTVHGRNGSDGITRYVPDIPYLFFHGEMVSRAAVNRLLLVRIQLEEPNV